MISIFNFQFSIFNLKTKQRGFTLVEMLVSIIVLVAVGAIVSGAITSSLRGASKANTIENIRQNGSYALSQMSRDIEYAQTFDGENTGLSNDGLAYDIICAGALEPIPVPETIYKHIAVESVSGDIAKYSCDDESGLKKDEVSLVDLDSVSVSECSFKCIQDKPTNTPIIKIKFTLSSVGVVVVEKSGTVTFETSVTKRNYGQ